MNLFFITNDPVAAKVAIDAGASRIFVDLETRGKAARQSAIQAHLSAHVLSDVSRVRKAVPVGSLLVRCNPVSDETAAEIDQILDGGADIVMVPMFHSAAELESAVRLVKGRARVVGLVETPEALADLPAILSSVNRPDEVFLGLNDLSLALGLPFLFQPLADGTVDAFCSAARSSHIPFGFGGVGAVGTGEDIPAELILSEHVRLGSTSVILSRAFRRSFEGMKDGELALRLTVQISEILRTIGELQNAPASVLEANRRLLVHKVGLVVARKTTQ